MAKAKEPQNANIVLTITIPMDGSGTASMVANKGDVARIKQFAFADANDIAVAIWDIAQELVGLELNPPPAYNAPKLTETPRPAAKAAPAAPAGDEDATEADDLPAEEPVDETEEESLAEQEIE